LVSKGAANRDPKFYSKSNPPKDNAPITDLLDYWRQLSSEAQDLRYQPEMTREVRARLLREISKNPRSLTEYLNVLKNDPDSADFVKDLYDSQGTTGVYSKEDRSVIKRWLTYNSHYFSNELAGLAESVSDTNEYVTNQEELLALTRVDFSKAQPIIDRLYGDSSLKASRVLARWALYRHALDTGSTSDIDRYREELKEVVEDKTAPPGMRDLAMDALAGEKEWPGRDEWYYSLLADETLADLRVDGTSYTGLTTLILMSPDEKYLEKMVELAASGNVVVRSAAVKNLVLRLEYGGIEVVKALLPWLEDPKWANDTNGARQTLVRKLSEYEVPESVTGLIKALEEKHIEISVPGSSANANMAANAVRPGSTSFNGAASNTNTAPPRGSTEIITYPLRYSAVSALAKQRNPRAVPYLRRILSEGESYERGNVVGAILACGGFTLTEQLEALEIAARGVRDEIDAEESAPSTTMVFDGRPLIDNAAAHSNIGRQGPFKASDLQVMLGAALLRATEISDDLARAIVRRINDLDEQRNPLAAAYRRMILKWQNAAINILLLNDVKTGIAGPDTIIRLLSQRKELREKQPSDVFDMRTGKPAGLGITACLLEDATDYDTILSNGEPEAKTALLACARLIRAPLPVAKVADSLASPNALLSTAAERYLESEDSPEARSLVLARHPNEARILGATSAFFVNGSSGSASEYLWVLYQSVGNDSLYNGWSGSGNDDEIEAIEKRLQDEVKKDDQIVGVYAYDKNYIRIYQDRVIYSWDEDDSRYRERPLNKYEFDELRSYLTSNRVDELPPFLSCGGAYCEAKELVMLSRTGGRRVYMNGDPLDFFSGLDKYFADLKQSPAALKYTLSRDIPGLEILLASDALHAETVWSAPGDVRAAASDVAARKKLEEEIENIGGDEPEAEPGVEASLKIAELRAKMGFTGLGWYALSGGESTGPASQPVGVEYITIRDTLAVQPSPARWRAKAGDVEIRTSNEGIFKVVRGRLTKLRSGEYENPAITPNGRWVVASKLDEPVGTRIVRIDLTTGKEYPVEIEGYGKRLAAAYINTLNRFLIVRDDNYEYAEYQQESDLVPRDHDPEGMVLLDAATGALQPIAGEYRPLSQQTFRPLQPTSTRNQYWAAMPDHAKNETVVGIYDTGVFGFTPVLRIPRITFNSMNMWVAEDVGKVYFVYRGHVLALPLTH
jgi:HEAT repeat protein